MEKDLRRIIALEPDDASALNALGYTLANHNRPPGRSLSTRLSCAGPAPRRSGHSRLHGLGSLQARGPEAARDYLRRAYEKFPDPEVAAHYGEVLWVLGAQNQARQVWRDARESDPDAPHIRETMDRLEPNCEIPPYPSAHRALMAR